MNWSQGTHVIHWATFDGPHGDVVVRLDRIEAITQNEENEKLVDLWLEDRTRPFAVYGNNVAAIRDGVFKTMSGKAE